MVATSRVAQVQAGVEPSGGAAGLSPPLGGPFRPNPAVLAAGGGMGVVAPLIRVPAPVGVAAPVSDVPAPPPQVDEEDPMDLDEGEDQEDPDPPEGARLDALLELEVPGAEKFAGMPSPLAFVGNPIG